MATIFDKIWKEHIVYESDEATLLYIDMHLIHEVTSPQAFEGLRIKNRRLRRPDRTIATQDHNTPTIKENRSFIEDQVSREQLQALEKNTQDFGVELFKMGEKNNGIVHMMGPEIGVTQPGRTIVCGDSHTATHGAFGAIAFGIGTTEVEQVFATQCIWQKKPKNLGVKVTGTLPKGVYSKDIILYLIGKYNTDYATGYAVEFFGDTMESLSMDQRMTITNMAIEWGAKYGLVAPDQKTYEYLRGRKYAPKDIDEKINRWNALKTDSLEDYDMLIELDVSDLKPQITWGTNPAMVISVDETIPDDTKYESAYRYMAVSSGDKMTDYNIDEVFIGSCTNGRYEDLEIAARILKGKKISHALKCYVVPGSENVKAECIRNGLDKIFIESGCEFREPGCSYCLAMNDDKIQPYHRCASTSNRNFEGRQGEKSRTHLVSPHMAALAAIHGKFVDARETYE